MHDTDINIINTWINWHTPNSLTSKLDHGSTLVFIANIWSKVSLQLLCVFWFRSFSPPWPPAETYCPPLSERWPLCPPSSPLGLPVTDGRGCCGTVADHEAWSVRHCSPLPGTRALWCCGRRLLPPWYSESTGTLSRCGSVSSWTPGSPTAGPVAWAGYPWQWGLEVDAWALRRRKKIVLTRQWKKFKEKEKQWQNSIKQSPRQKQIDFTQNSLQMMAYFRPGLPWQVF